MPNSKRARDYKAEEARRNERAKALGFTSRAQMRRALKTGAFKPKRASSSPRSRIVGRQTRTPSDLPRLRKESQAWSNRHSRQPTSTYDPAWPADKVRRYHKAYVDDSTRAYRIENGLDSLRDFLVDEMGYYTDEVFDERYGLGAYHFV